MEILNFSAISAVILFFIEFYFEGIAKERPLDKESFSIYQSIFFRLKMYKSKEYKRISEVDFDYIESLCKNNQDLVGFKMILLLDSLSSAKDKKKIYYRKKIWQYVQDRYYLLCLHLGIPCENRWMSTLLSKITSGILSSLLIVSLCIFLYCFISMFYDITQTLSSLY